MRKFLLISGNDLRKLAQKQSSWRAKAEDELMENKNNQVGKFLNQLGRSTRKGASGDAGKANMETVDKILPGVMSNLGLEKRLREHSLMQLWPTFLPPALAEKSRPIYIDLQKNLVVAVSDASVAQELSLMKSRLMLSLKAAARSLGLELTALRIDMKNFHKPKELEIPQAVPLPQIDKEELNEIELSSHDKQLIVELSKELGLDSDVDSSLRQKALRAYEGQLRLAQWRRQKGFPVCEHCRNPVSRLYELDMHKVCFNCWGAAKI